MSGRFFGAACRAAAEALAGFLVAPPQEALVRWRARTGASCGGAAPTMSAALDRDIAAIDAMLAEQLDAILHHALRRLEAAGAASAGWSAASTAPR